jgi:O-antigen biosynthesis protein
VHEFFSTQGNLLADAINRRDLALAEVERISSENRKLDEEIKAIRQESENLSIELAQLTTLGPLRQHLQSAKNTSKTLRVNLATQEAEAQRFQDELAAIHDSRAWKLTRRLGHALNPALDMLFLLRHLWMLASGSPRNALKYMRTFRALKKSGLFDPSYYLNEYSDVAATPMDPLVHFVKHGAAEKRNPNPFFNTQFYLRRYPDVHESGINPLLHYAIHGWQEGRDPCEEFCTSTYLRNHPDVAAAGINPLYHYYWRGKQEARSHAPRWVKETSTGASVHHVAQINPYFQQLLAQACNDKTSASEYIPLSKENFSASQSKIKAIAFYLPQFHPFPENDEWWGKGFTEWTNVSKAVPQFIGHYQPHLPGELGFYDLRLPEVQERQVELAKKYGLYGFCFHYYWFGGKRLLERPLNQFAGNPRIDFPFCVCWANENWTRRWDGMEHEVLMAQKHSPEDDLELIQDLAKLFKHPRYIRIAGKPLLILYRADILPDAAATVSRWRDYCRKEGIGEIYLIATETFGLKNPERFGFDAGVEFPPHVGSDLIPNTPEEVDIVNPHYKGQVSSYKKLVEYKIKEKAPGYTLFKAVMPSWDNEARRPGRGHTFAFSTPSLYSKWLQYVCEYTESTMPAESRFIFINAWNEWGEGTHLEPDRKYGYAYLDATAETLKKFPSQSQRRQIVYVSHDASFNGAQLIALFQIKCLKQHFGYDVHLILVGGGALIEEFARYATVYDFALTYNTQQSRSALIQSLWKEGARTAICNTSVVGETVELLKNHHFTTISLIHELPGIIKSYRLEDSIRKIAAFADKHVFPCEYVRDKFKSIQNVDDEQSEILPQGLYRKNNHKNQRAEARTRIRKEFGIPADSNLIIGVGYGDRRKGVDLFAQIASLCASKIPNTYFCWIGDIEPSEMLQELKLQKLGKEMIFAGERKDPGIYYAGADVFLLTSREDPFPSVVLEALDASLPVICFDETGGIPNLLRKEEVGLVVPHLDAVAMSETLSKILSQPRLLEKIGNKGPKVVRERFYFLDYVYKLLALCGDQRHKVSVIVPNYNYRQYLRKRLCSIIDQTYAPYEIIFLDDCSTDGSVEYAEQILSSSVIPYKIIRGETNQGCYRQWLKGISESRGDILWIAEADDYCEPTFLETLIQAFDDEEVVLSYCQSKQIDENDRLLAENYLDYTDDIDKVKWRSDYVRSGLDEILDSLVFKNTIPNASAVLLRKADLTEIEASLARLKNTGDWLTYMHVISKGKIAFSSTSLNHHRRHSKGITIGHSKIRLMQEIIAVQKHATNLYKTDEKTLARIKAINQKTYENLGLHLEYSKFYDSHPDFRSISIDDL